MTTERLSAVQSSSDKTRDIPARYLLLAVLLGLTLFYANLAKDSYMDDFRAFYVASLATHDHLDPYVNHVDVSEKYADAQWLRTDSRFIYPPSALLFIQPLRQLPYKWSKTAFGTLMALIMAGTLYLLHRRFPRQHFVLLALFVSMPMFMNIDNGNLDVAMLALTLAAFYLEDGALAGLCLGLAISIKFAPILALLWFATSKRWRTVVYSVATAVVFGGVALARWGTLYYREFFDHLLHHAKEGMPVLDHTLTTVTKLGNTVLITTDGIFAYQHDVFGYAQSPLHALGRFGGIVGISVLLAFTAWLAINRHARALTPEQSFFLFLVLALLANHLLWAMGLVACFPLVLLLVDQSPTPNRTALVLLVPLFLTKQLVGEHNFLLWLIAAAYCIHQNGWLRQDASSRISPAQSH